ncbi:hypothetical protein SynRS9909_00572 [Synechococcus sp. RS9909]|uniref:hypothetical protein n=1 Tax=Synechococcus sp. RS9909 TaxID=221352 RepID=UPI00006908C4|nr:MULTISPECIES: hypothetical protein [unclassified Synechococcus]EAQ68509.1 hypothetical protein RS9917_02968 [Synechococcus sp. RS9917]QNI78579.1 hypothetical protein SynRS9909_00572 [Synechococcus sp. RS9909]
MAAIQDHDYLRLCAEIASCLSISQASARRRVELAAARDGVRDLEARKAMARQLLAEAQNARDTPEEADGSGLDALLVASPEDEHFMLED